MVLTRGRKVCSLGVVFTIGGILFFPCLSSYPTLHENLGSLNDGELVVGSGERKGQACLSRETPWSTINQQWWPREGSSPLSLIIAHSGLG